MFPRALGLALLLLVADPSQALDISPPRLQSVLGQPLQVQIALRLSAGDKISKTLTDPCFTAEVSIGERALKASEFMRSVDWQAADGSILMRLRTAVPVTEPLVQVSLGCPRQQFSLMLDPAEDLLPPPAAGPVEAEPTRVAASKTVTKAQPPAAPTARRSGPALRLDAALSERASGTPAAASGDWFAPLAGIRLLLALDVGGPAGATPETHPGVEGPRPDRIKQAEAQFAALQGEQKQLQAAMTQLGSQLLAREQRRAANQTQSTAWLVGLAVLAALAALAGAGVWFWKRRAAARRG